MLTEKSRNNRGTLSSGLKPGTDKKNWQSALPVEICSDHKMIHGDSNRIKVVQLKLKSKSKHFMV